MNRKSIEIKSMGTFQFELFNKLIKEKKKRSLKVQVELIHFSLRLNRFELASMAIKCCAY